MIEISRSSSLMIACWSIIDSSIWEILVLIRSTLSLRSVNCAFICVASSLISKLELVLKNERVLAASEFSDISVRQTSHTVGLLDERGVGSIRDEGDFAGVADPSSADLCAANFAVIARVRAITG